MRYIDLVKEGLRNKAPITLSTSTLDILHTAAFLSLFKDKEKREEINDCLYEMLLYYTDKEGDIWDKMVDSISDTMELLKSVERLEKNRDMLEYM